MYTETSKDLRLWKEERSRLFTVRSTYKIACTIKRDGTTPTESSRTRDEKIRIWKQVWQLNIKLKLKHFGWKCVHNWLAMGETVKRKDMDINDRCKRCGFKKKTREHLLFYCPESELVWKLTPL